MDSTFFSASQSWRDYRTLSRQQRVALDFLTNKGPVFSKRPQKTPFVLYGGAAWGGKSYWLRSAAFEIAMDLRDQGFPNQWGVILCDSYPNLVDRHISKIEAEFAGIGKIEETTKRGLHVKFYGEGMGGVYLRNLVNSGGKSTRRGAEFAYVLGDELTEWTRDQFGQVMYTARAGVNLPYFARGFATNPDGVGHGWVKSLFVPAYRDLDDPIFKSIPVESFLYVPARKNDNPAYEQMKDVIDGNIAMESDPGIRRARDLGDWDIYGSGRFPMFRRDVHRFKWEQLFAEAGVPTDVTPELFLKNPDYFGFTVYASFDYATSVHSVSAYYLHLVGPDGRAWTFHALRMIGLPLEDQAAKIKAAEKLPDGSPIPVQLRWADPALFGKASEDQTGLTRDAKFRNLKVHFVRAVNDRVEGAATMESKLYFEEKDGRITKAPRWRIHESCVDLLKQIPDLPRDKDNPEDVDPADGVWHDYDAARYFLHTRFQGGSVPQDRPVYGSAAWFKQQAEQQDRSRREGDWLRG